MFENITTIDGKTMRCAKFEDQREAREKIKPMCSKDGGMYDGWRTSWLGISRAECFKSFETGDLSTVPQSDKMLAALEDKFDFPTSRYKVFDDVAGGVPNIPAVLACQPVNMRVRRRTADDAAPLTICIDLTSSADIDPEYLVKRGTAILALARILSSLRPVTIWLGAGLSGGGKTDGSSAWFQIDSAPLDLARAAFQISSGGVPRGMLYTFLQKQFGCGGGWPLHDVDRWRKMAPRFLAHWFEGEILFVPPVFTADDFKKPEVWLERMVKQYGGRGEE